MSAAAKSIDDALAIYRSAVGQVEREIAYARLVDVVAKIRAKSTHEIDERRSILLGWKIGNA